MAQVVVAEDRQLPFLAVLGHQVRDEPASGSQLLAGRLDLFGRRLLDAPGRNGGEHAAAAQAFPHPLDFARHFSAKRRRWRRLG